MSETYRKAKIESYHSLIQILLDQTCENFTKQINIGRRDYLNGQADAYRLVLKILEKEFELSVKDASLK